MYANAKWDDESSHTKRLSSPACVETVQDDELRDRVKSLAITAAVDQTRPMPPVLIPFNHRQPYAGWHILCVHDKTARRNVERSCVNGLRSSRLAGR
jgi:hypothetical protein